MRTPPRVEASCWTKPPMQDFRIAYTNMLVSKNPRGPNTNPHVFRRKPPPHPPTLALGFALGMSISYCLSPLCSRCAPYMNAVSGGIWVQLYKDSTPENSQNWPFFFSKDTRRMVGRFSSIHSPRCRPRPRSTRRSA